MLQVLTFHEREEHVGIGRVNPERADSFPDHETCEKRKGQSEKNGPESDAMSLSGVTCCARVCHIVTFRCDELCRPLVY